MNEEALLVGPYNSLAAIFSSTSMPQTQGKKTAVILLNSGLIHHAGPARLYTRLARSLATDGLNTLRFDLSGIGDSIARQDNLSIYQIATQEPIEVMDYLQSRGFEQFILAGICSGAYCAFKTALADSRVIGTVLVNFQDDTTNGSLSDEAWSQRYWRNSLFRVDAWKNLLTGNINYKRLFSTLINGVKKTVSKPVKIGTSETAEQTDSFSDEMDKLLARDVSVLMLMSGLDISQEFLTILMGDKLEGYQKHPLIQFDVIKGADHLFTSIAHQQQFIDSVKSWALPLSSKKHLN